MKWRFIGLALLMAGCATFYELNYAFNKHFEQGEIAQAADLLSQNKRISRNKTRFLYYANQGTVAHLLGNYATSNDWLEKAYLFGEDYRKNYLNFAASYFLNPNLIVYPGEDHEHLMLLYYKVLNYLKLQDLESALVECRRLNQRLLTLGDRHTSAKKFQKDAFFHNLMGIAYDAAGDHNNAFIAYRNAVKIYEGDYGSAFGLEVPHQLKKDLLRTASLSGLFEEVRFFEKKFDLSYRPSSSSGGELLFFWHNGLSPIKEEWSINFTIVEGSGGRVFFQNGDLGLDFPFNYTASSSEGGATSLTDLRTLRIAFPKYKERPPYFTEAEIQLGQETYPLQKAEDVNAIAFRILEERMLSELGKGLLRVALKKAAEKQVRKENETLGFLVSMINFASEQADTRNWQTLPHSIYYTRVPLQRGKNEIAFTSHGKRTSTTTTFEYIGEKDKIQFQSFQSLESDIAF